MSRHGYEDVSVKDVRQELRNQGIDDEETLAQNKKALVDLLLKTKEDDDILFEAEGSEDIDILEAVDSSSLSNEEKLIQPAFNSESWSEWVISQFADDELENGAPICDGLRRVAENILGPIEKVEVIKNDTPNINNKGNATVVVGITINPIILEGHPRYGKYVYVEDLADANKLNTPEQIFL